MKLTRRLVLMILAGVLLVLAGDGAVQVWREVALFESDVSRDHELLSRALGQAVRVSWTRGGDAYAEQLSREVARDSHLSVRWLNAEGDQARFEKSREMFRTITPVEVDGKVVGAFEIVEPRTESRAYLKESLFSTVASMLIVMAIASLLIAALGRKYVGRPIKLLVEKARKIGHGDFSGELRFADGDELSQLADQLDATGQQLADAKKRIEAETTALRHAERLATVGQLAAGIAHQLGTPLNVVSARAEMLIEGDGTRPHVVENATAILAQTERVTKIVRQLLDFARQRPAQMSRVHLGQVVGNAVAILTPLARRHRVTLATLNGGGDIEVEMDAAQIEQVLTNLIMNAIQATPVGGTVSVESWLRETWASIRVRDSGAGIKPEDQERLFAPFFTTKPVGEGTGLGLAVAHGIITEHHGFILVDSEVGRGSAFTICLPANEARRSP